MTEDDLIQLLKKELIILDDASKILKRSYDICKKIGAKDKYPFEELDHLEALTSRFARLSDMLLQKILRLIDQLDLESSGTIRDRLNRAEKKELISNVETFTKIRLLRNEIAHEYMPEEIHKIFLRVMKWTPELLSAVKQVKTYSQRFIES